MNSSRLPTEPKASIVGSSEVFMKLGSDINITCVVTGHTPPLNVVWYHTTTNAQGEVVRTEITTGDRGGVQLVTDRKQGTSWLLVDRASKPDAGNYTCAPPHTVPAHVTVHVIQGMKFLDVTFTVHAMQDDDVLVFGLLILE
ncbi:hypothetical protein HAZT_HAZT002444 [Hyalella azteca]|uniref:Ig-like domain-containing protein n=1 Tax=Hyalella azteca TaxID=294128 RepID=A0A6A0H9L6_HYAAZ|nr:hypothetical protein HAZT_HAZT002444 [Hyalella azteca]